MTRVKLVEDNFIPQNLLIKESKWPVIHEHCMQNINQIDQGVGNQILCVPVLNRSGEEMKKNEFLPLLLATNWISQHVKSRPVIPNANCRKFQKFCYNPKIFKYISDSDNSHIVR